MYELERKETLAKPRKLMMTRESSLATTKKNGSPYSGRPLRISGSLARHIKDSFGIDSSELSMRESPEVAGMGARATAQGNAIRFAPGEFRPDTREGLEILGHELSHVREQARGGVRANMPGSNIHYDAGHEAASDKAGEAFAGGSLSAAAPVSVGGMSAEAAPVQGLFGRKKPIHKQSYADIRKYLQKKVTASAQQSSANMRLFGELNPHLNPKEGSNGQGGVDNRLIGKLGNNMNEKDKEEYYRDYGSNDPERRKKHIERLVGTMTGYMKGFTPEMGTEEYMLNNIDDVIKMSTHLLFPDHLMKENPNYKMSQDDSGIMDAGTQASINFNALFSNMLMKYGLNQEGMDAPAYSNDDLQQMMQSGYLQGLEKISDYKTTNPVEYYGDEEPKARGGSKASKLWSALKGAGSKAGNAVSALGSIGYLGAKQGLGKIGSGIKNKAGKLGSGISNKWLQLRTIFD